MQYSLLGASLPCLLLLLACSADAGGDGARRGSDAGPTGDAGIVTRCSPGGPPMVCRGDVALTCDDDEVTAMRDCAAEGLACAQGLGCTTCVPGRHRCDGETSQVCNDDGTGWTAEATCDPLRGEECNPTTGTCVSLCQQAESSSSYIGCEYWPTPTVNRELSPDFAFAVVVGNPQTMAAEVTVTRGGSTVETRSVPPGGVETIELPADPALRGQKGVAASSALVRGGAYRLRSTVPVTAHQFNPLEYRREGDCASDDVRPGDGECLSFTNDASLLLPTHVLTGNAMVLSWPAKLTRVSGSRTRIESSPGFFTVVGVTEAPVEVQIDLAGHVAPGGDASVAGAAPGESRTVMLGQGDVLQVVGAIPAAGSCPADSPRDNAGSTEVTYCRVGADYDLTGTEIRATGPVAVLAGHDCAFVPFNRWACDHLEEAMFPLEAWGKDYVVGATQPLRSEPNVVRVVSGRDGNALAFDPAVHPPVTLDRGAMVEFETGTDFRVTGSEAFLVGHYTVGHDYEGLNRVGAFGDGDPAFSIGIPQEQFRNTYDFLAPTTYETSWVTVVASSGTDVVLDGTSVSGWTPIGTTGLSAARVMIPGGTHHMTAANPFGIEVYGFGTATSYLYPGGLDFEPINIPF